MDIDQTEERGPSPEPIVHVASQEKLGPSEEEDSEFQRELAKLLIDASAESRKVDKKTALALWDSSVLPPATRRKRVEEPADEEEVDPAVMNFTLVTKRGNKQQVRYFYRRRLSQTLIVVYPGSCTGNTFIVSTRRSNAHCSTSGQRRAAAPEALGLELRTARGGGRNSRYQTTLLVSPRS